MKIRPVQSVRFDGTESPPHINCGDGWTVDHARKWLRDHELSSESVVPDGSFLRAKQFDGYRDVDTKHVDVGVMVIVCERSE